MPLPSHAFKVTDTHLRLPKLELARCVRAYISRNTQGVALAPSEMFNHYPASPLCSLMWVMSGEGVLVSKGGVPVQQNVPWQLLLSGPHTVPSVTRNAGEVNGFMALFMPDALQAMTGLDITQLVNTAVHLPDVLDAAWQRMAREVLAASDDLRRIDLLEAFLLPRWQACRASGLATTARYQDWMSALAVQAALSGVGKSTRQLERRVKLLAGQSLQKLRGIARAETSFFEMRDASEREMLSWAELAFNAGFSDQAHMCREVKRITGFSPEEVRRAIAVEESFWMYRLWQ